jgi:hypothetical protein
VVGIMADWAVCLMAPLLNCMSSSFQRVTQQIAVNAD